jgi:hypothetical protein
MAWYGEVEVSKQVLDTVRNRLDRVKGELKPLSGEYSRDYGVTVAADSFGM